jgi:DNA-binding NtrC family response regulator
MAKDKLLICDDEEGVRESLKLILSEKYELIFAGNDEEVLKNLRTSADIKLILLDIKMPKKSGLDILKDIRSFNKNIPVIMVTGYQSVETASEAIKAGASEYIVKPFESDTILATIEKIIP